MGPGVRGRDDAPGNLVGVWGRARPAGSGLERERVNVAPRVKEAMGVVRLPLEWESSSVEVLAPCFTFEGRSATVRADCDL